MHERNRDIEKHFRLRQPLVILVEQLAAPEAVFEAIPELEFDQTANLAAEAGHDQWTHRAGADAEPVPDLEFDQTLGL